MAGKVTDTSGSKHMLHRMFFVLAAVPVFILAIFVGTVISAIVFGGAVEP